jgi:DNA-binding transcriptional LysR family regulator
MDRIWQDLDKLGIFVAVADKGKISEASKVLHLTQPSVSRAIQKLEDAFECKLFVRGRGGAKLTAAGVLLYDRATRMLKELSDIKGRARDNNTADISGNLLAGTYESLAEYLWPDFLTDLKSKHPQLNLSIKTSHRNDPIVDLIAGRIDLLVDAEPQTKGDLVSWPLYSDRFGFYSAPGTKLKDCSREKAVSLTVLYVQGAYDENRVAIEDHLERAGYNFGRECCFDSFSTIKRLAIRKMGIAVLPTRLAYEDVQKNLLSRIDVEGFNKDGFGRHTICATIAQQNEKEPRLKEVIRLLKGHFR